MRLYATATRHYRSSPPLCLFSVQFAVQQSFAPLQKVIGKGAAYERGAQGDQRADFGILLSAKSLDAVDLAS